MAEVSEGSDMDFLGDGTIKDLAIKMGEIDKQLEEIAAAEAKADSPKKPEPSAEVRDQDADILSNFEDSRASIVSDVVLDDDGEALATLQGELQECEQQAQAQQEELREAGPDEKGADRIVVTVVKPTKESKAGISMKTSKGVTVIVGIAEQGLLHSSKLKPGLELVQINGVDVKNAKHARHLIQDAADKVNLVARPFAKAAS